MKSALITEPNASAVSALEYCQEDHCFGLEKSIHFYHCWKLLPGDNVLVHWYNLLINEH